MAGSTTVLKVPPGGVPPEVGHPFPEFRALPGVRAEEARGRLTTGRAPFEYRPRVWSVGDVRKTDDVTVRRSAPAANAGPSDRRPCRTDRARRCRTGGTGRRRSPGTPGPRTSRA